MIEAPLPADEVERLARLRELGILYTPAEERFDRVTRLACRLFDVPLAMVTLIDADAQWFKSRQGMGDRENPRTVSFCAHAILGEETMVVPDALEDPRFADNPLVIGEPFIRFYAGHPLAPNGSRVGTLCTLDRRPRTVAPADLEALRDLAAWVENELRVSALSAAQRELISERDDLKRRAMLDPLTHLWNRGAIADVLARELARAARLGEPVSILLADLDRFKVINDSRGHAAGDAALLEAARRMRGAVRAYDAIGRYGGEEFLVVLGNCGTEPAAVIAETIRRRLAERPVLLPDGGGLAVTASLGVATAEPPAGDPPDPPPSSAPPTRPSTAPRRRAATGWRSRGDRPDIVKSLSLGRPMTLPGEEAAPRMLEPSSALAAIERARFDSYSSLVRNLHWLAAALVVLYGLLFPTSERPTLWSLAGVMMVYTLLLHSRLFARLPVEERVWLESAIDLAWITAVIVWTGATRSPFAFLYYIVLYSSMPTASRRETYAKAGAATLLLLSVAALAAGRSLPAGAAGFWAAGRSLVWPLTGLWLVAYFSAESGSLGADLHHSLFVAAHTDALTGLPNLRYFTAAAGLRSKQGCYTIVMVDIDHLKTVNDTFGHARGSALIRAVADALRSAARSHDDLCSRVGGDEFIVRLAGATGDGALAYCRRVRAHLADHPLDLPLQVGSAALPISVSMGLASYPEHGRTLSEVTERADAALYASKRDGRSRDRVWAA